VSVDPATSVSPLMRVSEVAKLFDVDPTTVRRWSQSGKLKPRRTPGGRQMRFLRSEVYALLETTEGEQQ
jgi:excisionase family DNA binding protein